MPTANSRIGVIVSNTSVRWKKSENSAALPCANTRALIVTVPRHSPSGMMKFNVSLALARET